MRIAIVNDMFMAVEAMRRVLAGAGGHQIAWIARDGAEAVERCAADRPDLILMDLIMPRMDGVEATRQIMARTPCAIVVVTANVNDHASQVFEAMGCGALDAVNTPVLGLPDVSSGASTSQGEERLALEGAEALLRKVETIRRLVGVPESRGAGRRERGSLGSDLGVARADGLVAIGASAGGPAALAKILEGLPKDFPASVVVVQHVDVSFAVGLADWLRGHSRLLVRLASEGDCPVAGSVLLAGQESHLVFTGGARLGYSRFPLDVSYRPSVDVFFRSVAEHWRGTVVGVLLTGMGRDGAEGLKLLRSQGHLTIAQDQASSAVYGMPKAAAELDAAADILPLDKIGPYLAKVFTRTTQA